MPYTFNNRLRKAEVFPPVPDGIQDPAVKTYLNELLKVLKELEYKNACDHEEVRDILLVIP